MPHEAKIEISGYRNLNDIDAVTESIILKSPHLMIKAQIDSIRKGVVSVLLNYNGGPQQIEETLKSLDHLRIKNQFSLIIANKLNPYIISIKDERNEATTTSMDPTHNQ